MEESPLLALDPLGCEGAGYINHLASRPKGPPDARRGDLLPPELSKLLGLMDWLHSGYTPARISTFITWSMEPCKGESVPEGSFLATPAAAKKKGHVLVSPQERCSAGKTRRARHPTSGRFGPLLPPSCKVPFPPTAGACAHGSCGAGLLTCNMSTIFFSSEGLMPEACCTVNPLKFSTMQKPLI